MFATAAAPFPPLPAQEQEQGDQHIQTTNTSLLWPLEQQICAHVQPTRGLPVCLSADRPHTQIVGRTSSWIDPDAADTALASSSCAALQQQLSWAAFLGLQAVLLPAPRQLDRPFNYAQVVNQVGVQGRLGLLIKSFLEGCCEQKGFGVVEAKAVPAQGCILI